MEKGTQRILEEINKDRFERDNKKIEKIFYCIITMAIVGAGVIVGVVIRNIFFAK